MKLALGLKTVKNFFYLYGAFTGPVFPDIFFFKPVLSGLVMVEGFSMLQVAN